MKCIFCGDDVELEEDGGWECFECLMCSDLDYDANGKTVVIYTFPSGRSKSCPTGCLFIVRSVIVLDSEVVDPIQG